MDKEYPTPQNSQAPEVTAGHSGNVDKPMRETPPTEFSETPLRAFEDIQLDNIPHSPATLPENMPSIDDVVDSKVAEPPIIPPVTEPKTNGESAPKSNRVRNGIIAGVAGLALAVGGTLVGVKVAADNKDNEPPKTDPKATSEASAAPSTTPEAVAPTPDSTPLKTPEAQTSNVIVDTALFDNWENKKVPVNPNDAYTDPDTKEYACEQTFVANGIAPIERREVMELWDGQKINDFVMNRLNLVYKLYTDKSNPQYVQIAKDMLTCMTSQRLDTSGNTTHDAHTILSELFDGATTPSIPILGDLDHITRETSGTVWSNGTYNEASVEFQGKDIFGDTSYPVITYEWTKQNDFRIVGLYNLIAGSDDVVAFGRQAPQVLDPSRADAPYNLG
jgi:hypothetical protein